MMAAEGYIEVPGGRVGFQSVGQGGVCVAGGRQRGALRTTTELAVAP